MSRKRKVWGTDHHFVGGKQVRVVVATFTKKQAMELLDMGRYVFETWVAETGNTDEVRCALMKPEKVLVMKFF